jgi:urease subunit gamma/beta
MHLTPREQERLLLAAAADLARRRLARGAPLGATEAVALVCDEICELAWDGIALETVIERARMVIPASALLPGVAALVPVLEVEALFPWGTTLVHVDRPFPEDQDSGGARGRPGQVRPAAGQITLAPDARRRTVALLNTGHRDVWISSHFPLDQVNPAVEIRFADEAETGSVRHTDCAGRDSASGDATARPPGGCRLDLPAGEALLLRPGEERTTTAVLVADSDGRA